MPAEHEDGNHAPSPMTSRGITTAMDTPSSRHRQAGAPLGQLTVPTPTRAMFDQASPLPDHRLVCIACHKCFLDFSKLPSPRAPSLAVLTLPAILCRWAHSLLAFRSSAPRGTLQAATLPEHSSLLEIEERSGIMLRKFNFRHRNRDICLFPSHNEGFRFPPAVVREERRS